MQNVAHSRQAFINRQFFNLTLFTLIFGVMFYDVFDMLGFSYVDEICAVLLLGLYGYRVFTTKTWEFNRAFLYVIGVFIFYLVYSIIIHSNTKGAILLDFVVQIKPYIAFFCVFALRPVLSVNQKKIIRQLIVLCSLYVFTVGALCMIESDVITYTFSHVSRLATASSILALLYLYCSDYRNVDKLVFCLILAIGLFSTRSKHFGFLAMCTLLVVYFNRSATMRLNLKNSFFLVVAIAFTIIVAWKKIYFYFVTGGFGGGREAYDLYARMALYYFSGQVFMDFIPFGSGFASYATYASAVSYSPLYVKYEMSAMHGLTKAAPDFVADTYYPALAQFGFAGVLLFLYFWAYLAKKAIKSYSKGYCKESLLAIMIILFFLIECTSDSTITHNRGMFMMMLMGLCFADMAQGDMAQGDEKQLQPNENTVSQ